MTRVAPEVKLADEFARDRWGARTADGVRVRDAAPAFQRISLITLDDF